MDEVIPVVSVSLILVFACGFMIGGCCCQEHYRTQAVKHGAAEWEVHDDGSTSFKWKGE